MFVKKGKIQAKSTDGTRINEADVWEVDLDGEKLFAMKDSYSLLARMTFNQNIDELYKYFTGPGDMNPTVTWIVPLTEVPSTGGGAAPLDVYPVGIEITTTDTAFNPMKVWGGTWTVTPAGAKRVWKRIA